MSLDRNEQYQRSDAQLYGAFKYPTLRNEDAVLLASLMDDCLYAAAAAVDVNSTWTKTEYAKLAVATIFKKSGNGSYSTVSDRYFVTTLPLLDKPDWLTTVRTHVSPFRDLLNTMMSAFEIKCSSLPYWSSSERWLPRIQALERELGCTTGGLYGAFAEVQYQLQRYHDISNRMSRPYLRRIVSVAKGFANRPDAFLENYQNGYHGALIAIGKYDSRKGAFAFFVDVWIKNRMISGITNASNSISLPERVWKHKRLLERHSNKEIDEIAKIEGVNADLLRNSALLLDVRNAAPLIEENDENNESLDDYHDLEALESENQHIVNDQLQLYTKKLSARSRLVLGLAFDVNLFNEVPEADVEREAARQLYIAHARSH